MTHENENADDDDAAIDAETGRPDGLETGGIMLLTMQEAAFMAAVARFDGLLVYPHAASMGMAERLEAGGLVTIDRRAAYVIVSASAVLQVDAPAPEHGGARSVAGQKPRMNSAAVLAAYLKFWPVSAQAVDHDAALPVIVALQALNQANRQLFTDREALTEVVVGAVMDACDAHQNIPAVMAFAEAFVGGLPQVSIHDPAYFAPGGKTAQMLISMYARMAKNS